MQISNLSLWKIKSIRRNENEKIYRFGHSRCYGLHGGRCSAQESAETTEQAGKTEIVVFAAASMTDTMNEIAEMYKAVEPDVNIVYNFDSPARLRPRYRRERTAIFLFPRLRSR